VSESLPQQKYQVRFDVGLAGFRALAGDADVIILADALPAIGDPAPATPLDGHRVIVADLGNPAHVAQWVLARQTEKADRFSVAVIAVGERRRDGSPRPAVEDFLLAGEVIDELSRLGIAHCSPEAAAPSAGFLGLRRALLHLVSASETAVALGAAGRGDDVRAATDLARPRVATDAAPRPAAIVPVREFRFPA